MDTRDTTPNTTVGKTRFYQGKGLTQPLFCIEPGILCERAREQASELMGYVRDMILSGVMDENPQLVWASYYLSALAKALMDDAEMGYAGKSRFIGPGEWVVGMAVRRCDLPEFHKPILSQTHRRAWSTYDRSWNLLRLAAERLFSYKFVAFRCCTALSCGFDFFGRIGLSLGVDEELESSNAKRVVQDSNH